MYHESDPGQAGYPTSKRLHGKIWSRLRGLPGRLADRVTRLSGSPHLSCKRDQIKMRDYMDRRVALPKQVTSPTWGPPPPCKQALNWCHRNQNYKFKWQQVFFLHLRICFRLPTSLASGGVGLFIHESLNYTVLEKISNEAFQALCIEISFAHNRNIIWGIIYRQHNSPDQFMSYFEETIEKLTSLNKMYLSCLGRFQYRSIEMRNILN